MIMEHAGKTNSYATAQAAIAELRTLVMEHDPIELVARVATYVITGSPEKPTDEGGPSKSETNLEYLLSLVTAHPFPAAPKFPDPDVIQRTIELLTLIHLAASHHLMTLPTGNSPAEEAVGEFAASFRADKLHVRGDGYWPHLRQTTLELLRPHDARLRTVLGFTSEDYLAFMERTEAEGQARLDTQGETHIAPYVERIRPWLHEDEKGRLVPKHPAALARFWEEHEEELTAAKNLFDCAGGPEIYVFSEKNEAERRILAALSTACGGNTEFHGRKPEHAFWPLTESRTDKKPILRHADRHYAFQLTKLQREAYTLIGDLLRVADPSYWQDSFLKARDDYLEAETARLVRHALPSAEVLTTVAYPLAAGGLAETDIIVLCDDVLMVVECKATRLDAATKRGADRQLIADLKATIAGGLNQAERFVRELVSRGTMVVNANANARKISIEAGRYRHLMRINVTLDLISPASTGLWKLQDAGLTGTVDRCWSVSLNDLRVITEILDQPAVFLHYLLRRLELNGLRNVHARDELDFLMHYVRQGLFFREGNAPKENQELRIVGFTEELDQYYRRVQGLTEKGQKPTVTLGRLTQPVIALLQTQRPQHWTTGCLALLEFDVPGREDLLARRNEHRRVRGDPSAPFAFSLLANWESRQGVVVGSAAHPNEVAELLQARVSERCRQENLDEIVILLGGLPMWDTDVRVIIATPTTTFSQKTARLLRQLVFAVNDRSLRTQAPKL